MTVFWLIGAIAWAYLAVAVAFGHDLSRPTTVIACAFVAIVLFLEWMTS